mmetsp:Transcript_91572/g.237314  ORF Transcript_91572/g.237314 Transcript_91572/m.237314 type:complete len:377 (+) Transcript_91572:783-1913(+)
MREQGVDHGLLLASRQAPTGEPLLEFLDVHRLELCLPGRRLVLLHADGERGLDEILLVASHLLAFGCEELLELPHGHGPELFPLARSGILLLLLLLPLPLAIGLVCEKCLYHVAGLCLFARLCRRLHLLVLVPLGPRPGETPFGALVLHDALDDDFLDEALHPALDAQLAQGQLVHRPQFRLSGITRHLRDGLVHPIVVLPLLQEQLDPGLLRQHALGPRRDAEVPQLRGREGFQLLLLLHQHLPDLRLVRTLGGPDLGLMLHKRMDHVLFFAGLQALFSSEVFQLAYGQRLEFLLPGNRNLLLAALQCVLLTFLLLLALLTSFGLLAFLLGLLVLLNLLLVLFLLLLHPLRRRPRALEQLASTLGDRLTLLDGHG